jgi:uncharacterized protein (TIGR02001 family)
MKQLKVLSAVGLLALAGTANAGLSSTVTATNDYDFRGITQTDEDPALQASIDFATEGGWYVGAWASNVDFPGYNGSIELDGYTGFTGKLGETSSWDAGVIYYSYPNSSKTSTESKIAGFPEIYGSMTFGMFKGKVSYSNDFGGSDEDAFNIDGGVNVPLPANFSFVAHVGYSAGDGVKAAAGAEYLDYSAGAGLTLGNFALVLKYVDTDRPHTDDGRVIFTVATTFPWK